MQARLEIIPLPVMAVPSASRRQCRIVRTHADGNIEDAVLWIEQPADLGADAEDCDPFLMMVLMEAMRENLSIHVHGSVDRELLSNLTEFQRFWHRCRPETFTEVPIHVGTSFLGRPVNDQAICTFTGGLDSSFTVWRHSQRLNGHRNRPLALACMLHGADIPLANREGFAAAFRKAEGTLASVGVQLAMARTNFREISRVNWEDSHGIVIGAALSCFKARAGIGLIASGKPYEHLRKAWGSSPITDPLLSSSSFHVIHDGADHDRTEKAAALLDWQEALRNLRVCWEGSEMDRNCGHCHKCTLTKLNFLAAGAEVPPSFPPSDILSDIRALVLPEDSDTLLEWHMLLGHASKMGIEAEWMRAAKEKLGRTPSPGRMARLLRRLGRMRYR